jgi:uncharacterized membrane protein YidH (DUF202 family)
MNTTKTLGAVLIILSLLVGYVGINKISDNTKQINLLGLKIDASNESGKQQGYLYVGFAVLLFGGGLFMFSNSKG